jgi:O-antigen ligase
MHAGMAVVVCAVVVIALLRWDRRQSRSIAWTVWIPTLWMLLAATKPLAVWLGMSEEGADEAGSLPDRAVLVGLLLVALYLLRTRRIDWSRLSPWLLAFVAYELVSIAWSDIPFVSFKRWVRDLLAVVMALLIYTEPDPRLALQSVLRRTVYVLVPCSLLLVKYFPAYGVAYGYWDGTLMWVGVTDQKNGLGRVCLVAIFFLVWSMQRRWGGREVAASRLQTLADCMLLVIAAWLLTGGGVSTYSATAVTALASGLLMLATLLVAGRKVGVVTAAWAAVAILVFIYGTALPFLSAGGSVDTVLADALGRDQSFTGRTDIWARLMPFYDAAPLLGHGFGGFWTATTEAAALGVKEAHNGYLAVLLDLGAVGLAIVAILLASAFARAKRLAARRDERDWAFLLLCMLVMLLVHIVSEASMNSLSRHLMAVFLFVTVAAPAARRVRRSTGAVRDAAAPPVPVPTTSAGQAWVGADRGEAA